MKATEGKHETAGDRILAALDRHGLTQAEVAAALQVSRGYINNVVHGRKPPSKAILQWLHAHHGVSTSWVLYGSELPSTAAGNGVSRKENQDVVGRIQRLTVELNAEVQLLARASRNADLHALLDQALPDDAGDEKRGRVRGFLEAIAGIEPSR